MQTELIEAPETKEAILFSVSEKTIAEQFKGFLQLKINGVNDRAGLQAVKSARMAVVHARTSVEKTKTKMNEEAQKQIKRNGADAKKLLDIIAPYERHLTEQQTAVEVEIARLKQEEEDALLEIRQERMSLLGGVLSEDAMRHMTQIEFEGELEKASLAKQNRDRIAAEEAEEAFQRDQARAAETERNRVEAERLAAERAEFNRQREAQQAELDAANAKLAVVKAEQDAAQRKIDAENKRIADAEAERQRQIQLEGARKEAAEKSRIETEERLQREADYAKAEANRKASEDARVKALMPDRAKLESVAMALNDVTVPAVSDEATFAAALVHDVLLGAHKEIMRIAALLTERK